MVTFPFRISGIPCQIRATIHGKYRPAHINAPAEFCQEAEYPDVDYEVLDRKGYPAPWLAAKLTDLARMNIEAEALNQAEKDRDDDYEPPTD
jgi:hypothetical protein